MTERSNLVDRGELQQQLAAGEFKTSIDVILAPAGWLLQKLLRRKKPPTFWINAFFIALLISIIAYVSSLFTGGVSPVGYRTIGFGGLLIFLSLGITKSAFDRTFRTLHSKLLDGLESNIGLTGLKAWLVNVGDIRKPALVGLFVYVANVVFVIPDPVETPIELIIMGGVLFLWTGFVLYYTFLFVQLPLRLGRCQFKLHAEEPVSTEVLVDWSGMMNFAAYMLAFSLATGTLFTVTVTTFTLKTLTFLILRWIPLIAIFIVNQIAISGIVTRSKRKSLSEVEAQMAKIRPRSIPPDHETMETLLHLWDYHDRIKDTRNSTLDVTGIINFVNTLLIPLLAFLIANREIIFEFLGWTV
jgi:hypothetical protein